MTASETTSTTVETIRERFTRTAIEYADATAVIAVDGAISYREFADRAADLAATIADARAGGAVALDAEPTTAGVAAMVGVLLSGSPLVMLDDHLPEDRREAIRRRAGAERYTPSGPADREAASDPGTADRRPIDPVPADPARAATLLFTSGSTGAPKAVRQGHRMWLNQADEFAATLGIGPGDRTGLLLPLSFGGGLDIVIASLLNGATLLVLDPRTEGIAAVASWLARHRPTTVHAGPSLMRSLLPTLPAADLAGVRLVTTCGEPIQGDTVATILARLESGGRYCNLTGSSETGNIAFAEYRSGDTLPIGPLPAGIPAVHKVIRLVDDDGSEVAAGAVGILEIESDVIAEGYVVGDDGVLAGDPDAFTDLPGDRRRFRTGDLARFDADGVLWMVGRRDDAVKIRGYLVEPAEVVTALRAAPGVDDAVVTARTVTTSGIPEKILVGYAAVEADVRAPSEAQLRRGLLAALPSWMVPRHIVILTGLPRNERGKVDRSALPNPQPRPQPISPETATERRLAQLWCTVLGVAEVGRDDDFIGLGGDSLQAQQMLTGVAEAFAVAPDSAVIAAYPTLRELADYIDRADRTHGSILVPLQTRGTRRPVFCLAGAGSTALALLPLARALGPDQPVYGLQANGLENRGLPDWTIRRAARRYLRHIRRIQPVGPYVFVGHSIGGVIAMDIARLLEADGETVETVVCLDTVLTGPLTTGREVPETAPTTTDETEFTGAAGETGVTGSAGAGLWRTRAMLLTAGLWRYPAQVQWDLFHELGRRVALLHRFEMWDGDVHIVLAQDNPDTAQDWRKRSKRIVSLARIPGDHVGILREPYVRRTAELVRSALDRART